MMRNDALPPVRVDEPFHLTTEEQDFVRKCLNSQFWSNELPYSFAAGLISKMAMKMGYMKQSNITILSTTFIAFVISRGLSYRACFHKLIQQPGNTIAERMNQRKRIIHQQHGEQSPTHQGEPESIYSQPNYLDVDINKPDYPDLDPSTAHPPSGDVAAAPSPGQTYAELRKQNRESYQQPFRGQRPPPPPATERPILTPIQPPPSSSYESSSYSFDSSVGSYDRHSFMEPDRPTQQTPVDKPERSPYEGRPPHRKTNKYGDVWDE